MPFRVQFYRVIAELIDVTANAETDSKWQPDTCIIILKEMQRNINFSVTTTQ